MEWTKANGRRTKWHLKGMCNSRTVCGRFIHAPKTAMIDGDRPPENECCDICLRIERAAREE